MFYIFPNRASICIATEAFYLKLLNLVSCVIIKEMKQIIFLFLLAFSLPIQAQTLIKVAVIDAGLDLKDPRFTHLCPLGHRNLTSESMLENATHGTHVAGLIQQYAKNANYCMLIYKFFAKHEGSLAHEIAAIKLAIKEKVQFINISGGGGEYSQEERNIIQQNPKITFIVAAGNGHDDLDSHKVHYYPAQYHLPNVVVVGNIDAQGKIADSSNYGRGVVWEVGEDIVSTCPNNTYCTLSGSSMSTAIRTGKLIYQRGKGK